MRLCATVIAVLSCLAAGGGAFAQQETSQAAKIFESDAVISATIDGPWRDIARYKESDRQWQGTFSYTGENGRRITIPVTITTRGLTRLRVCDFPPIRLVFDTEAAKDTAFRGAGSLKMVTHCQANTRFEQYYIKEYLAYRIYNMVTPKSFRVQGLDVSYTDAKNDRKPINRFGFLIEDPDDLAKRNGLKKLNILRVSPRQLDADETSRFMLFQYLISNLDWSVLSGPRKGRCCHNARLIGAGEDADTLFALPYDLDSSGLVNTYYAAPPEGLRVRNVQQRLFRGFCRHNGSIPAVMDEYRALEDDIIGLFQNEERLDSRNRNSAIKFLRAFYRSLSDAGDLKKRLTDNCRG